MGIGAGATSDTAWHVRWDKVDDAERLVLDALPEMIDFHTSGTTGPSRCWRRIREKVWAEAGLLADLLRPQRPEALVSFVPPVHLYGALATMLVPARLGIPAWYRPRVVGSLPAAEHGRWAVVATPWIFSILQRHLPWVLAKEKVTILHGGAMLPATATDLVVAAGADRTQIVEVFGCTEAGGVAYRRWRHDEAVPWTLFPDVTFDDSMYTAVEETELAVHSPRMAFPPDGVPPEMWVLDDHVSVVGDRQFRFDGRRNRLVNVNGRRMNLDDIETSLRSVMDVVDVALLPVADRMVGEHVDLLVVPRPGRTLADANLREAIAVIGVRPRSVHVVEHINRSETGKLRAVQPMPSPNATPAP